jgi:four helix bundle protein
MRDHNKLRAFELADNLVVQVYKVTVTFPKYEQFGLTSQLRRAAVSIPSNIVEGCARQSQADYLRFINIAYGSACEVEYQISLARKLGFLEKEEYKIVHSTIKETCKVLNGLQRSLTKPEASGLRPQV